MTRRTWTLYSCIVLSAACVQVARAEEPNSGCHKSAEWSDMMVCGNPNLTDLGGKVDRAYADSERGLSPEDAGEVRRVQQAWLKGRAKCQESSDPTKCLQDYYQRRIKEIVQPNQ